MFGLTGDRNFNRTFGERYQADKGKRTRILQRSYRKAVRSGILRGRGKRVNSDCRIVCSKFYNSFQNRTVYFFRIANIWFSELLTVWFSVSSAELFTISSAELFSELSAEKMVCGAVSVHDVLMAP